MSYQIWVGFFCISTINLQNECLKPVFEYKITCWICTLVLWIHKGYCVVKNYFEIFVLKLSGIQTQLNIKYIKINNFFLFFRLDLHLSKPVLSLVLIQDQWSRLFMLLSLLIVDAGMCIVCILFVFFFFVDNPPILIKQYSMFKIKIILEKKSFIYKD